MRRFLSVVIISLLILELSPINALSEQKKLKIGVMGVFIDGKEDISLSNIVAPVFSTSDFFNWEKIGKDTPTLVYWGIASFDVKFKHNASNVSTNVRLLIKDTRTNVDMFILETNALSSPFSGTVLDWKPLEKEAFLNAIGTLSKRLDDIWRSSSIVIYAEENAFESDLGKDTGIVEGTILSIFRDNKLVAKGRVTSLGQKTCKGDIIYKAENEYPRLGDIIRIAYIPPSPEVSFINQATPVLNAIVGIAILAGLVTLYNIAKANMATWIRLRFPENNATFHPGDNITFLWLTNDTSIKNFALIISGNIYTTTNTSYNYIAPSVSVETTYVWKVIGYREDGTSIESESRTFKVVP
ncbi:MAG: hypothetical protein N2380_04805 [bacterium]|nr:hypothetical protein [bacterium]